MVRVFANGPGDLGSIPGRVIPKTLKRYLINPCLILSNIRYVASTEKDIDTRLTKAWTAIERLSIIWKSDLTDKMKRSFFQAAVASILLYGCSTWTLTKRLERKLDGNYTRILRAILNKSCRQHPTRHQLYGHLPSITKTIQVRRTRHAEHCWRSRDELISDVLLWTPTHGHAKAGRPARLYFQQLCEDTRCCPEDQPEEINDREKWQERVMDIRATSTTWWWSRVKWSNPGKGVESAPTPRCSRYWKRSLLVALDYGHQLYFLLISETCHLKWKWFLFFSF